MLIDRARTAYASVKEERRRRVAALFAEVFGDCSPGVSENAEWIMADGLIFRFAPPQQFALLVRCRQCGELGTVPVSSIAELGQVISGDFYMPESHFCSRPFTVPRDVEDVIGSAVIPVSKSRPLWEEQRYDERRQDQGRGAPRYRRT